MPIYLWTGKNAQGVEIAEKITAPTPELARDLLEKRGYTDLKLLKDDLMAESTLGEWVTATNIRLRWSPNGPESRSASSISQI